MSAPTSRAARPLQGALPASLPASPATTAKGATPQPVVTPAAAPPPPGPYAWQRTPPVTASIRRRAAAFAVDLVLVFVLTWTLTFVAAALDVLRVPDLTVLGRHSEVAGLLWIVSIFELPLTLLYFSLAEPFGGRTPGKILFGLRVRRVDGHPVGLFDAFLRNLLRLLWVTPFGPAFILLDLWALQATELDQRLGDLAAETVVLDERARIATA